MHLTWAYGFCLSLRCSQKGTWSKILFENKNYFGVQLFYESFGLSPPPWAGSQCWLFTHVAPSQYSRLPSPPSLSCPGYLPLNLLWVSSSQLPGLRPQDMRNVSCPGLLACPTRLFLGCLSCFGCLCSVDSILIWSLPWFYCLSASLSVLFLAISWGGPYLSWLQAKPLICVVWTSVFMQVSQPSDPQYSVLFLLARTFGVVILRQETKEVPLLLKCMSNGKFV